MGFLSGNTCCGPETCFLSPRWGWLTAGIRGLPSTPPPPIRLPSLLALPATSALARPTTKKRQNDARPRFVCTSSASRRHGLRVLDGSADRLVAGYPYCANRPRAFPARPPPGVGWPPGGGRPP